LILTEKKTLPSQIARISKLNYSLPVQPGLIFALLENLNDCKYSVLVTNKEMVNEIRLAYLGLYMSTWVDSLCLVDQGLYVATRVGSLCLPLLQTELGKARVYSVKNNKKE
jgi:hypothetical protein